MEKKLRRPSKKINVFPEKSRNTKSSIVAANKYIDKSLRLNKEIMIVFTDTENASNIINWNIIIEVLRDVKVDYRVRRIILKLCKNQRALIS